METVNEMLEEFGDCAGEGEDANHARRVIDNPIRVVRLMSIVFKARCYYERVRTPSSTEEI